jgi:hypothetical protein
MRIDRRAASIGVALLAALALAAPGATARATTGADNFNARATAICAVEMGAVNRQMTAVSRAKTTVQYTKAMTNLAKALRKLSTRLNALSAPPEVAAKTDWRGLIDLTRVAADDYDTIVVDVKRGAPSVGIKAYLARANGEVAMAKIAAKKLGLTACSR